MDRAAVERGETGHLNGRAEPSDAAEPMNAERVGAKPVFVDIEGSPFNMDPGGIEAVGTERTRAIMPVHLYGNPVDMAPVSEFARAHVSLGRYLLLLNDPAQLDEAAASAQRGLALGPEP